MPLPDNMELDTPQTKEWPLIPANVYQAEITDIEYKSEPNRWKKYATDPDEKRIMKFEFTIINEGPNYGRKVWQKMSMVKPTPPKGSSKGSWIYKLATALAGHPITKELADRYTSSDINGFIHRQVKIFVIQAPGRDGKVWNNIDAFIPVDQQLPPFDKNRVSKENQPTEPEQPQPAQPAAQAAPAKTSSARAAMQRGMEKHQHQQESADDIEIEDIPF